MMPLDPLKLVRFLSSLFRPFNCLSSDKCLEIAKRLFGSAIGNELCKELQFSSSSVYCDGDKYLTAANVFNSIKSSYSKWKDDDFFVLNTMFNRPEQTHDFLSCLRQFAIEEKSLQKHIPILVNRLNKKFNQSNKDLSNQIVTQSISELLREVEHYRFNFLSKTGNICLILSTISDPDTFCKYISAVLHTKFLYAILFAMALDQKNVNFCLTTLKQDSSTFSVQCALTAFLASYSLFNNCDIDEKELEKTIDDMINLIYLRQDRSKIFANLIEVSEKLPEKNTVALRSMIRADIAEKIKYHLANTRNYSEEIQRLLHNLYSLMQLNGLAFFADFSAENCVTSRLTKEIAKFLKPLLTYEVLGHHACTIRTLSVLVEAIFCGYRDKKFSISIFKKIKKELFADRQRKYPDSTLHFHKVLLNLLTIELLVYNGLITGGEVNFLKKAEKAWKELEDSIFFWNNHLFTLGDEFVLTALYSIFNCQNFKPLVERNAKIIVNRPFPLIKTLILIFYIYSDLKEEYSHVVTDYISRYQNQYSTEQYNYLLQLLDYANLNHR